MIVFVATPAFADDHNSLYDRLWPNVPGRDDRFEELLYNHLTELGNMLGQHVDVLSYDMVAMKFDARRQRAWLRVGGGEERYLTFRIASDVHFTEGLANVRARVDLGVAGRTFHFELPSFEMAPVEYRGSYGVEVRLPLFRRDF